MKQQRRWYDNTGNTVGEAKEFHTMQTNYAEFKMSQQSYADREAMSEHMA